MSDCDSSFCLRTPRMLLRPWRADDRAEFIRIHILSEEFWRPWMPDPPAGETPEQAFDRLLRSARFGQQLGTHVKLVAQLDSGRLAGLFSLSEIVRGAFHCAYAGWRVSADVQGQGMGTEGVLGLLDLAFAGPPLGLGLHRVQANVIPTNHKSLRVVEKCGFRHEGYAKDYLHIAGQWQDHVMFAKIAAEHDSRFITALDK